MWTLRAHPGWKKRELRCAREEHDTEETGEPQEETPGAER